MGVLTVGRIKVCIWCPQSLWCVYSFYRSVAKISFVMAFYTYPGKALTLSFHCLKYRTIYFWHLLFVLNTVVCISHVSIHKASPERAISSPCSDSTEKPPDVVTIWLGLCCHFIIGWGEHSSAPGAVTLAVTWVRVSPWQLPTPSIQPRFPNSSRSRCRWLPGDKGMGRAVGGEWWARCSGKDRHTDTHRWSPVQVQNEHSPPKLRLHLTFTAYNTRRLILLKEKRKFLFWKVFCWWFCHVAKKWSNMKMS